MTNTDNARRLAVAALLRIQQEGGYSNIVLSELLERTAMPAQVRPMIVRLVYGVTERRLTLDYLLNKTSATPVKKMQPPIREILRVGVYQLVYMDSVPAFAAIHESVELAKKMGFSRLTGFVNGVLRQVQRSADTLLTALPDTDKGLEIRHSCPRPLISLWRQAYGEDTLNGILSCIHEPPPQYIRVNTCRTTTAAFAEHLASLNIECCPVDGLPDALQIVSAAQFHTLLTEDADLFYYQDIASQWSCHALGAAPDEQIADVCAAPGGKSFTTAQYMKNRGTVTATDLYPEKCDLLRSRVKQYGFTCVKVGQRDATQPPAADERGQYDRVICDVPCSGLGVLRRKPEIRYKDLTAFDELPSMQLRILNNAAMLVRAGGVLQYSTCTLRPQENEEVVAAFLEENPAFKPRLLPLETCFAQAGLPISHQITLFPHIHHSDGFFIAGFVRSGG